MTVTIRPIRPSDYRPVISVIDDWWGGRHMADKLPRLDDAVGALREHCHDDAIKTILTA